MAGYLTSALFFLSDAMTTPPLHNLNRNELIMVINKLRLQVKEERERKELYYQWHCDAVDNVMEYEGGWGPLTNYIIGTQCDTCHKRYYTNRNMEWEWGGEEFGEDDMCMYCWRKHPENPERIP